MWLDIQTPKKQQNQSDAPFKLLITLRSSMQTFLAMLAVVMKTSGSRVSPTPG